VRQSQWTKLPTSRLVIQAMNDLAGTDGIKSAYLEYLEPTEGIARAEGPEVNMPTHPHPEITQKEAQIEFDEGVIDMPALVEQEDDDSVSESSEVDYEMDDDGSESDPDDVTQGSRKNSSLKNREKQ